MKRGIAVAAGAALLALAALYLAVPGLYLALPGAVTVPPSVLMTATGPSDLFGRLLSRDAVLSKIAEAHRHGMAAMAYTAAYAAPPEFGRQHPTWGLYDAMGQPIMFGDDFLGIMNPTSGSPWSAHILGEYRKIVTDLPFDGVHIDQYGEPRFGFAYPGGSEATTVDVASALAALIDATKAAVGPNHAVMFNDVGGWPLEDTAPTQGDAVYIEVWPPYVHFEHLHQLIADGRRLSGGKPVILAAYIDPASEPSVLLTDAVIFASGGYHLELGEGDAMLADPYFPKYRRLSAGLRDQLRRYYDVAVRYQDLLYGPGLTDWNPDVTVQGSQVLVGGYYNGVWALGRQDGAYRALSLINLNGLDSAAWKEPRTQGPTILERRRVTVAMKERPRAVYAIDPDGPDQSPRPVPFTYQDGAVSLTLERLAYWSILAFEN